MALIISPEGKATDLKGDESGFLSLKQLQKAVGGYIEIVRIADGISLVVNEEGHLLELPINYAASVLSGQPLAGTAVLCTESELEK